MHTRVPSQSTAKTSVIRMQRHRIDYILRFIECQWRNVNEITMGNVRNFLIYEKKHPWMIAMQKRWNGIRYHHGWRVDTFLRSQNSRISIFSDRNHDLLPQKPGIRCESDKPRSEKHWTVRSLTNSIRNVSTRMHGTYCLENWPSSAVSGGSKKGGMGQRF